jgi:hypothetical protein
VRCEGRRLRPSLEPLEEHRLLSIFTVMNTSNTGPGSLRNALQAANQDPLSNGADPIEPISANLGTIDLDSPLPALTRSDVTILGMDIDGSHAGGGNGLVIEADSAEVLGSTITGFAGTGLVLSGNGGDFEGNQITSNRGDGIDVTGGGNRIGGRTPLGPPT